jgi:hypothetical protein
MRCRLYGHVRRGCDGTWIGAGCRVKVVIGTADNGRTAKNAEGLYDWKTEDMTEHEMARNFGEGFRVSYWPMGVSPGSYGTSCG